MNQSSIAKMFEIEYKEIVYEEDKIKDNEAFLEMYKKNGFRLTENDKNAIINRFDFLKNYSEKIDTFLGNQNYAILIKNDSSKTFKNAVKKIKDIQINNGLLIEKYNRVINSQPSLFINYFTEKISKRGTYDRDINRQFQNALGYTKNYNYSISEFYRWVTNQKIIGEGLVNQLIGLEKQYDLHFTEINKGLYDSLFIGHKNWSLITPNSYTFLDLDNCNMISGKVTYECGTCLKDGYKTSRIPKSIDTIVLHNPYSIKECETLYNISDEYNVILSFFGSKGDYDYRDKESIYKEYLSLLKDDKDNKVFTTCSDKPKQYVKTIVSIKK